MTPKLSFRAPGGARRVFFLLSLCVLPLLLLSAYGPSPVPAAGGAGGQTAEADPEAQKPHHLVGSYYSTHDGLTATLLLNNKGGLPLEVRPTIYDAGGQALDIAPLTVEAGSFRFVDLREWAAAGGESFARGSVKLFHVGKDLVLGAQIHLTDEAHRLTFEEKLAEVGKFDSRRAEGVWWMPSPRAESQVVLSNTTDAPLAVTARLARRPRHAGEAQTFALAAHETRVLDLRRDFADGEQFARAEVVALSLEHAGAESALLARAMVRDGAAGYSNVVQFSNPGKGKSSEYQGVGFRVDEVEGERLAPVIVARNVGAGAATLRARVPYTRADDTAGVVELEPTTLRAGEMKLLDTHQLTQRARQERISVAGLEVTYNAASGSVIVNAHSVGAGGDQVFRVPMWDPLGQRSPTGGYPWRIEGTSTTMIYIKNITDREQSYVASLRWPGGDGYTLGMNKVAPHQTVEIDIRRLRDEQVPDVAGRVIPSDLASGQLMWSLKQTGPAPAGEEERQGLALMGRTEQVDVARGVSSNYACQNCCSDSYYNSGLWSATNEVEAGASVGFTAWQQDKDCYGNVGLAYERAAFFWDSSDTSTATVGSNGAAAAQAAGETTIEASWTDYRYDLRFVPCYYYEQTTGPNCNDCNNPQPVNAEPTSQLRVRPRITSISPPRGPVGGTTTVTINGQGFRPGQTTVSPGAGITASVSSVTATQVQASFAVAADAAGGNRGVTVTARSRTSNSSNFFVQIPTSALVLLKEVYTGAGLLANGCPTNMPYGFRVRVRYQVLDQQQPAVAIVAVLPVRENLYNFTTNGNPFGSDQIDVPVVVGDATQADGTFIDQPVGACATDPFSSATFAQDLFSPISATRKEFFRTNQWALSGRSGCGNMTNAIDINVSVQCQ